METNKWYTSKEAKSIVRISDCKLMQLRNEDKIVFKKKGKEFL